MKNIALDRWPQIRCRTVLALLAFLALTVLPVRGQEPEAKESKLDLTQRYLLLATSKTSTMQKELDEAAAAGYRILVGSRTGGGELSLLLEKVAEPPGLYEYLLLATQRTSTMQEELESAASEGFKILPHAAMGGETEIVVLLEKPPGQPSTAQYLLLATKRTGTLQKEIRQEAERGFRIVGLLSRNEHMAFMEKDAERDDVDEDASDSSNSEKRDEYLLLATKKTSTMQKELLKAAEKGHCIVAGAPTSGTEVMFLLREDQLPTARCENKLIATNKASTLQRELNAAAAEGYRLLPQTVVGKRAAGGGFLSGLAGGLIRSAVAPDEVVAVMEKSGNAETRYEYLVLDTMRTSTMQEELSQAAREGYKIIAMVGDPSPDDELTLAPIGNMVVLCERASTR